MVKKKKGSSFVIVVIIMAILFTLGTTMLTVTASDYKARISESNRLKNLYGADSGLDVVQNIIVKTSQKAIEIAEESVLEKLDTFNNKEEMNKKFKEEFFKLITLNGWNNVDNPAVAINEDLIRYSISSTKYINDLSSNTVTFEDVAINDAKIAVTEYTKNSNPTTGVIENIVIEVTSTFENISGELKDKKIIETKFEIMAPDFNRSISKENKDVKIDIYPVFDGKIITSDGNMNLTGVNNVNGDLWVKGDGNLGENPAYAFDKYRGGISVENGELNLTGNISTSKTLHLKNVAKAIISGDVYALNAYVGKSDKTAISSDNVLRISNGRNLVVNNDLALNAKSSQVNLHNFYGINDKTTADVSNLDKAMKSSSIIVNDADGNSTLNVANETYVMGVAYIDTIDEKYQTGESVAVKGNYLAYSDVLESYRDRVTLKYYNPLQLIDTIEGDVDKGKYFEDYYAKNSESLKSGGITLNKDKAHTVGAYVSGDTAKYTGWSLDSSDTVIRGKREDFAQYVFSMGDTTGVLSGTLDKYRLYTNGNVVKTVANQIKFKNTDGTSSIPDDHTFNDTYGRVVFNSDSTLDVIITKDKIKVGTREIEIKENEINGLVINAGDVVIDGEVTFNGTIICAGNVSVVGSGTKILNHNTDLVRKIIASNYDVLKTVFLGSPKNQVDTVNITVGQSVSISGDFSGYEVSDYVKTGRWKIVK